MDPSDEIAQETKLIIVGLLTSLQDKCTVKQLCNDFKKNEGYEIPYRRLGYNDVNSYLKSIPEAIRVNGNGLHAFVEVIVSSKSKHVDVLISKSKTAKTKRTRAPRRHGRRGINKSPASNTPFKLQSCQPSTSNEIVEKSRCPTFHQSSVISDVNVNEIKKEQKDNRFGETKFGNTSKKQTLHKKESAHKNVPLQKQEDNSFHNYNNVPKNHFDSSESRINKNIPSLLDVKINNSLITKNSENFSNSVELEIHSPSDLKIGPKMLPKSLYSKEEKNRSASPKEMCDTTSVNDGINFVKSSASKVYSKVPQYIQRNLRMLIAKFPEGLPCTELLNEYRRHFKKNFNYEAYNYRSVIEMCSDLSDIFHYVQSSSYDFILYDRSRGIPKSQNITAPKASYDKCDNEYDAVLDLPKLDWTSSKTLIPPNIVHLSEKIPRITLDFQKGNYVDLSMGEIYDLSKFWTYLTFGDLDDMMDKLQSFFQSNGNKYIVPESLLAEGLYCVSLFAKQYHRAVIIDLLPDISHQIRVLYIDYGTVSNINSNEVWYMPKEFGSLPSQAIRTRLSNIVPKVEKQPWTYDAIKRFNEIIVDKHLVGEIIKIDYEENIIEIYLADITNPDKIYYINDVFVNEGYALYMDQVIDDFDKLYIENSHVEDDF